MRLNGPATLDNYVDSRRRPPGRRVALQPTQNEKAGLIERRWWPATIAGIGVLGDAGERSWGGDHGLVEVDDS